MTTINANGAERDILEVIRELEVSKAPETSPLPDPVALRDKIKHDLEFITIADKAQLSHLVEGALGGKTIAEIKKDLNAALNDLDLIIKAAS